MASAYLYDGTRKSTTRGRWRQDAPAAQGGVSPRGVASRHQRIADTGLKPVVRTDDDLALAPFPAIRDPDGAGVHEGPFKGPAATIRKPSPDLECYPKSAQRSKPGAPNDNTTLTRSFRRRRAKPTSGR